MALTTTRLKERRTSSQRSLVLWLRMLLLASPSLADAQIKEVVYTETVAFGGISFGAVGPYVKVVGTAYGEVDPSDPLNAVITDIDLAPRNGAGKVEYSTNFYMLRPANPAFGNGLLYYNAVNRGDKGGLTALNRGVTGGNEPTSAGDGLAMDRGYTILWSGWQADVLPGAGRLTMTVPVAKNPDGSEITGLVRTEYIVNVPTSTQDLGAGSFTGGSTHASYETVRLDNAGATLTRRVKETDPREVIPNGQWAFADCSATPFPGVPRSTKICPQGGFSPNYIYELLYTAKNPPVMGLGLAATRDIVSFFRHMRMDDRGTPNPVAGTIRFAVIEGTSQSGRYVRQFLHLGFNEDLEHQIVFEGAQPHISPGRIPLNVRFGTPGRVYLQHEDHLYPAYESPFTWMPVRDRVAGSKGGLLERCQKTNTCPKIIQTVSSTEYWQGRMSLNTTDARGRDDVRIPRFVRIYHFAATQHGPVATPTLGNTFCQQLRNPNPYFEARRALLLGLERWVMEGGRADYSDDDDNDDDDSDDRQDDKRVKPPPNAIPTIREGTLVRSDQVSTGWPTIPGVKYTGLKDELTLLNYGPEFNAEDESGIVTEPPTVVTGRDYVILVPKVDADGNEIAGIRSTTLQAPLGTYTGWNLRRAGFAEDELCSLAGSFIPFRTTQAERLAAGDPRLSLQERYGTHDGYVAAVRAAADQLVSQGHLLSIDADFLVTQAEVSSVLR
jgi:alpha/beta hydrolase family protein